MVRRLSVFCGLMCFLLVQDEVKLSWAQYSPPNPPCTVLGYAPCTYLIPANDYVLFPINGGTGITIPDPDHTCKLNSVTITFQGAPTVPLLVWLTGDATSSVPVYMNGASVTVPSSFFGTGGTSWFAASQTWTNVAVQAIYPNPPPSTFYYPESCTILFQ